MDTAAFLTYFALYWLFLCVSCQLISTPQVRRALAALIPCLFAATLAATFVLLAPWQRLWLGTVALLYTIKGSILLLRPYEDMRSCSKIGLLIYMSIWPE